MTSELPSRSPVVDATPLLRKQPEERIALRQGHFLRRIAGRQAFERGARLEDLNGLLLRDEPHPRAPIALPFDQPLKLQSCQCGADGRAPSAERLDEVHLDQPLIGEEFFTRDGFAQP